MSFAMQFGVSNDRRLGKSVTSYHNVKADDNKAEARGFDD